MLNDPSTPFTPPKNQDDDNSTGPVTVPPKEKNENDQGQNTDLLKGVLGGDSDAHNQSS